MRRNLARDAIREEPENTVDLWTEIRYLDPDLQRADIDQESTDGMAIIIAILWAFADFRSVFVREYAVRLA